MKAAFKMKLKPGFAAEYKKRHDEIWPELAALLKANGISDLRRAVEPMSHLPSGLAKVPQARACGLPSST